MATLATDNFNRADENPLSGGGVWIKNPSDVAMRLVGNQAVSSDGTLNNDAGSYYGGGVVWPDDQYSQANVTSVGGATGEGYGVTCRVSGSNNYYRLIVAGNGSYSFSKQKNGVYSSLGSGTVSRSAGDLLKLVVTGQSPATITAYNNGTQFAQVTDSSPIPSGSPGICYSSTTGGGAVDNWEGGNTSTASDLTCSEPITPLIILLE